MHAEQQQLVDGAVQALQFEGSQLTAESQRFLAQQVPTAKVLIDGQQILALRGPHRNQSTMRIFNEQVQGHTLKVAFPLHEENELMAETFLSEWTEQNNISFPSVIRTVSYAENSVTQSVELKLSDLNLKKYQMLKEQIVNMQLSLRTAQGSESGNEDDIRRLIKYYEMVEDHELKLEGTLQQQTTMQDVNENNMYSAQNNENLSSGTENTMNMVNEGTENPMQTDAANNGELGGELGE